MNRRIETANSRVTFEVDESIFPRRVILRAAYHFIDDYYVRLERADDEHVKVRLKGKKKLGKNALQALSGEFENEVLHHMVRDLVAGRTDGLREVIVGRALLSAEPAPDQVQEPGSQDEAGEEPDYLDDPLGIAVPWEEKYGDEEE